MKGSCLSCSPCCCRCVCLQEKMLFVQYWLFVHNIFLWFCSRWSFDLNLCSKDVKFVFFIRFYEWKFEVKSEKWNVFQLKGSLKFLLQEASFLSKQKLSTVGMRCSHKKVHVGHVEVNSKFRKSVMEAQVGVMVYYLLFYCCFVAIVGKVLFVVGRLCFIVWFIL